MNIMKRTAGILTGILFLILAQVFLVIRQVEKQGKPILTTEWAQVKAQPDAPWIENPDDNLPALARNPVLRILGPGEVSRNPVAVPRFRFNLKERPNPLYTDRPPPAVHA